MTNKQLDRNIINYYLYVLFSNLLILGPIMIIYFEAKGLNFTEIMIINSISAFAVVVFEVPTGVVADKLGRKLSLLIGATLWGISLLMFVIGRGFLNFAIAEIIFSLGATFKSGADIALIYDSLKTLNRQGEFEKIEGRAKSFSFYGQAAGSVAAGFLYKINIELPMIVSAIFMFITVIITLGFIEPKIHDEKEEVSEGYLSQIIDSGKYIVKNEKLKAIILYCVVFFIFYRGSFFFYQPYFKDTNIPYEWFGILFALFNIVAGLTSKYSHKIMKATKTKTLTFLAALLIVSFFIMGFTKIWIGALAILLQQMARGLYGPVTRKYLNKNIPSNKRATILSFVSLVTCLAEALTSPIFGVLKDRFDIFTCHIILGASMAVLIFITSLYMNKRLGIKKEEGEKITKYTM